MRYSRTAPQGILAPELDSVPMPHDIDAMTGLLVQILQASRWKLHDSSVTVASESIPDMGVDTEATESDPPVASPKRKRTRRPVLRFDPASSRRTPSKLRKTPLLAHKKQKE